MSERKRERMGEEQFNFVGNWNCSNLNFAINFKYSKYT